MCAEGCSGVSHSTSRTRRTRCPPFHSKGYAAVLHFLFLPSHVAWWLTWFLSCTAGMLPEVCHFQRLAAHLGAGKLCCVASPWPLALLSVVLLLSEQAETEKELATLFQFFVTRKTVLEFAEQVCTNVKHLIILQKWPIFQKSCYPNLWLRKHFRWYFRDIHMFLSWQDIREINEAL